MARLRIGSADPAVAGDFVHLVGAEDAHGAAANT
jgi:hypothetical protein